MNLLLDTHAVYWFLMGDRQLSKRARRTIEFARNKVYVSAVSGYEMAYKYWRGKLAFGFPADLAGELRKSMFLILPITLEHTIAAGALGGPHSDPWDRLLMAQARLEDLIVVSRDHVFSEYNLRTLW